MRERTVHRREVEGVWSRWWSLDRGHGNLELIPRGRCNLGDCGELSKSSHVCQKCRYNMDAKEYKPATARVHPRHPSSRTQKGTSRAVEQSLVNAQPSAADAKEPTRLGFTNKGSATTRWTPRMASSFCGSIVSSVLIAATSYIKQDTEKDFSIQTSSACTYLD